jgi:hypothetical protein
VRRIFFALIFVNLAYFAWAHWVDVPAPAPTNPAIAKLPRLKLAEEVPPDQRPQAAAKPRLQPVACLSVGPFGDIENSAHAASILKAKGFDPKQRAEEGQMTDGFAVLVGGMKSQDEVDRTLVTLERAGIKDAVVMPLENGDTGRRLSLGLYSERARADKRAQAVKQAGLKVEVAERKIPGALYWIDLAPLPGMNTVPMQDLFAEGVSSHIAVQPCPVTPPQVTASTTASAPTAPAAGHAQAASGGSGATPAVSPKMR